MPMIKRVLVAIDGSEHANRAIDLACAMASRFGADLIAVHVVPDKPLSDAERKMAEVEFQGEVAHDFDLTRFGDARDDIRLISQRLTEQAAETARRFPRRAGGAAAGGCQDTCPSTSRAERPHRFAGR
jgi:nucleotide-binding universal stress UspA family protein